MLALVAEAQDMAGAGTWPADRGEAPRFARLVGIETRPRVARNAARALEDEAEVLTGDIRETGLPAADVVLLFDVLHMMSAEAQDRLLRDIRRTLPQEGCLYIREADAGAGWRFSMVRAGNRLKALLTAHWRQPFAFRTAAGWVSALEAAGFRAQVQPMGQGTPFGNVWLVAAPSELVSRDARRSPDDDRTAPRRRSSSPPDESG